MARDSGVSGGMSPIPFHRLTLGVPSTNDHRSVSSGPSAPSARIAFAFRTTDSTFRRFRTIDGSFNRRSTRAGVKRATFAGSNDENARRYPWRLCRIVDQERPACAPSRLSISKRRASSWTGTPHSSSWYARYSGSFVEAHAQRTGMAISGHASGVRLDVAPAVADEPDHRDAEPVGGVDGERRRRADRAHDGDPRHGRLLHDLERDPSRHLHDPIGQRDEAGQQLLTDHLVDRVVTTHIFANAHELAVAREQPRGVQPARPVEHA